jgi:hypothetical protein
MHAYDRVGLPTPESTSLLSPNQFVSFGDFEMRIIDTQIQSEYGHSGTGLLYIPYLDHSKLH